MMRLALLCLAPEPTLDILTALRTAGHSVHAYHDPQHLLRELGRETFDLLLIDESLCESGFQRFVNRLFALAGEDLALIFINCRDDESRLSDALTLGADDFIQQGVGSRVIAARIDAVLRRRRPASYQRDPRIDSHPYRLDLETRRAWRLDSELELTDKEFDLAVLLFQNPGRLFSRGHLLDAIWSGQHFAPTRTVDTHISRLRKKFKLKDENGHRLVSAYGSGYRLERLGEAAGMAPGGLEYTASTERPDFSTLC